MVELVLKQGLGQSKHEATLSHDITQDQSLAAFAGVEMFKSPSPSPEHKHGVFQGKSGWFGKSIGKQHFFVHHIPHPLGTGADKAEDGIAIRAGSMYIC